jgi:hypothetical protein
MLTGMPAGAVGIPTIASHVGHVSKELASRRLSVAMVRLKSAGMAQKPPLQALETGSRKMTTTSAEVSTCT